MLLIIVLTIKNSINSKKPFITEDDYYKDFKSDAELENKYTKTGSYETSYIEYKSDNKAIQNIKIWYPKELESGNVNLDDAIKKYTRAMELSKECSNKLNEVTEQVNKILQENGKLEDFKVEEEK